MPERDVSILLIEDNPDDAEFLVKTLLAIPDHKYEVEHFLKLEDGLKRAAVQPFDVAILELNLSGNTGVHTVERFVSAQPDLPVIALTSVGGIETAYDALVNGAQGYLLKGKFDGPLLSRIIGFARGKKVAEQELQKAKDELEIRVHERTSELDRTNTALLAEIEDRRSVQAQLDQSEAQFQTAFEGAPNGIVIVDLDGSFLKVNHSATQILGYTEAELLDTNFQSITYPDDLDVGQDLVKQVLEGKIPSYGVDKRYVRKDGSVIWAQLAVSAIRNDDGSVQYFISQIKDISDRKHAEERLEQQLHWARALNEISRAVAEHNTVESVFRVAMQHIERVLDFRYGAIGTLDNDKEWLLKDRKQLIRVVAVSSRGHDLSSTLRFTEGAPAPPIATELALTGPINVPRYIRLAELGPDDVSEEGLMQVQANISAGIEACIIISFGEHEEVFGSLVLMLSKSAPPDEYQTVFLAGMADLVILAIHNSRLYQHLEQAYKELKEHQEYIVQHERMNAMGQLASGITHDINNTLSPIMLYTDALLESEPGLSDRARRFLKTIQEASRDIEETTARLRTFYQKTVDGELQRIDPGEILYQVVELTRPKWKDNPQRLGYTVRPAVGVEDGCPPFWGNESEIRQALTNLVLNAVDSMTTDGEITLRARKHQASVALEVVDTGSGMTKEQKRKCLDPFYTTKGAEGSGLGLAMVAGIVQRHDGALEIESKPGVGTTVRLLIPAGETASANTVNDTVKLTVPSLRILSIDDDESVLAALDDVLSTQGHVVDGFSDPAVAIEKFEFGGEVPVYDLVITDLGMPKLDGREVARRVKNKAPTIPVILLSGWNNLPDTKGHLPPNVDYVLSKPPRSRDLQLAIARLHSEEHGKGIGRSE